MNELNKDICLHYTLKVEPMKSIQESYILHAYCIILHIVEKQQINLSYHLSKNRPLGHGLSIFVCLFEFRAGLQDYENVLLMTSLHLRLFKYCFDVLYRNACS